MRTCCTPQTAQPHARTPCIYSSVCTAFLPVTALRALSGPRHARQGSPPSQYPQQQLLHLPQTHAQARPPLLLWLRSVRWTGPAATPPSQPPLSLCHAAHNKQQAAGSTIRGPVDTRLAAASLRLGAARQLLAPTCKTAKSTLARCWNIKATQATAVHYATLDQPLTCRVLQECPDEGHTAVCLDGCNHQVLIPPTGSLQQLLQQLRLLRPVKRRLVACNERAKGRTRTSMGRRRLRPWGVVGGVQGYALCLELL